MEGYKNNKQRRWGRIYYLNLYRKYGRLQKQQAAQLGKGAGGKWIN